MDVKLEKAAMKGYELPKGLTLAEQGYYLALRTLYAAYQKGVVTKKHSCGLYDRALQRGVPRPFSSCPE